MRSELVKRLNKGPEMMGIKEDGTFASNIRTWAGRTQAGHGPALVNTSAAGSTAKVR